MNTSTVSHALAVFGCAACTIWLGWPGAVAWAIGMACGAVFLGALERQRQARVKGGGQK